MQMVYSTENRVFLYLLKAKLSDQGIESVIRNEEPAGLAAGEVPPVVAKPELWVLDDLEVERAIVIIQEELAARSSHKKQWRCSNCGEILDGQFDICWKCGHSKPE